jgi:replicative DNA helicase
MTQQAQNNTHKSNSGAAGAKPRAAQLYWLGDLLPTLIADNDAAIDALRTGKARGPCTGIAPLDEALGGFFEAGLHTIQANTGAGKTALALQIASDCQFPALYVSAEMPVLELFRRLIARQTNTFLGRLKTGGLSSDGIKKLALATAGNLPHIALMDATAGLASLNLIGQTATKLKARFNAKTVLVVIDSLHVWARSLMRGQGSEFEIVSEGAARATELAAILAAPIIALCHRNREGNKRAGGAGLHAARGSGDIEYESWSVLDLHRDMEEHEDANGEVSVTMRFYKNRSNGFTAPVETMFCGRLQSFRGL